MIRKLQKRFVRIAVLVLTAAMVIVVGIINTANLIIVRNELGGTVRELAENNVWEPGAPEGPAAPEMPAPQEKAGESGETAAPWEPGTGIESGEPQIDWGWMMERSRHFRNLVSESGWFTVYCNAEGEAWVRNLGDIPDLDEDGAKKLAAQALESEKRSGWIQDYCFSVRDQGEFGTAVVLMNCETRMAAVRNLALISGIACAGGILVAWLLVRLFSRKAVEPTIRNMEQQKQFITNASHELKTPLTVISTNMELLKMELPDNQWIRSTQKQTGAMRHLVDELVYLSRMEEENPALTMESLNPGTMLQEAAEPFQAMAEFSGKEMNLRTDDGLRITGDRSSLQRMMSTLLDNAVKYTPEGGTIFAETVQEGKHAVIRVSNTVEKPLTKEQCSRLFSRFYRADAARTQSSGGFGIGLSAAQVIVLQHRGRLEAEYPAEARIAFTVILPLDK